MVTYSEHEQRLLDQQSGEEMDIVSRLTALRRMVREKTMTADVWDTLPYSTRCQVRDESDLSPQLLGKEGYRVEVTDEDGTKRRFIVGRSTGWCPCHLEIHNRRSMGGGPASKHYASIRLIERVR